MLESKDPAIKLFGKKILFPAAEEKEKSRRDGDEEGDDKSTEKGASPDKCTEIAEQESPEKNNNEDHQNSSEDSKSKDGDEDDNSKDQSESSNSQENDQQATKTLKKPTKILPCPRCNSMDTKFCYYNNYNINQPRHFCKACQRYWTAGGTMRNVPVGAGRRKNKHSSSHYRHISISEALQAARIDSTHLGMKTNGRVLSFGPEAQHAPICDSMASVLKLGDQKVLNGTRNGFDQRLTAQLENGDDCSSGSSLTAANNHSTDEARMRNPRVSETHTMKNNNMNHFPCFPSVPWPYTWNPAIPPPAFFPPPPGFPSPFYPYWSIPVLSPQSTSSSQKGSSSSGPNSPTLGKHSRDEETAKNDETQTAKQRNGCVLIPKTLRIDDPNEAAKSSIWTTLGIKNEVMSKGGMFKGFNHIEKKTKNIETAKTSPVLRANPAALSRSIGFRERL